MHSELRAFQRALAVKGEWQGRERGGEVTCDLSDCADDHGLVGSRPEQVAVAGAAALLRVITGVLLRWGRGATDEVPLQQLSAGQDDAVIRESYAKPVG